MQNLTTKFDEDECPPLTEADFKKMRRYPVKKVTTGKSDKNNLLDNKSKQNSDLHLNQLAS